MQAELRAFGLKNSQKTTYKDQDRIKIKIFNDKTSPQQEVVLCNLKNLEKVKNKLKKIKFHYVVLYF